MANVKRTINVADIKSTVQKVVEEDRENLISEIKTIIDNRLTEFEEKVTLKVLALDNILIGKCDEIDALKVQVNDLAAKNTSQEADLNQLRSEFEALKLNLNDIKAVSDDSEKLASLIINNVKTVEAKIEERTNRQMRKTLVIKGIKELKHESWEDTHNLVAETICSNIKHCSYDDAYDMFDRIHRGPPTKNASKVGKRDIYAALNQWDDCEYLIDKFRKLNRKDKNLQIYIDYKYGPLTTQRQNEALKTRREMLDNNDIVQGYISYPAKLFVKRSTNSEWEMFKDFSREFIPGTSLDFSIY